MSKRFWIEYTGPWPKQAYHYNGSATTFWTLKDGRQVADAGTEPCYRYLLSRMDRVVPFVAKSDEDWYEVRELAEAEERKDLVRVQQDAVDQARRNLKSITSKSEAFMRQADELELESQRLRAAVVEMEVDYKAAEKELAAQEKKLKELSGEKDAEADNQPAEPKPKPKAKKPKAKPKGKTK